MSKAIRPILLLFMGENEEHAILSIKYFFPESVHIITSEKYEEKYEEKLEEWSTKYDFRKGKVAHIENLFTPESINSLLFSSFALIKEEIDNDPNALQKPIYIGITGGTMHMSATGTYFAQLIGGYPFYVMKPQEGQEFVAKRDIIFFPSLHGLEFVINSDIREIDYVMGKKQGNIKEIFENLNEGWLRAANDLRLIYLDFEEEKWGLTTLGFHSFYFLTGSKFWYQSSNMIRNLMPKNEDRFDPSIS